MKLLKITIHLFFKLILAWKTFLLTISIINSTNFKQKPHFLQNIYTNLLFNLKKDHILKLYGLLRPDDG